MPLARPQKVPELSTDKIGRDEAKRRSSSDAFHEPRFLCRLQMVKTGVLWSPRAFVGFGFGPHMRSAQFVSGSMGEALCIAARMEVSTMAGPGLGSCHPEASHILR